MRRLLSAVYFIGVVTLFLVCSTTLYQSVLANESMKALAWVEMSIWSALAGILIAEFLHINGLSLSRSRPVRFGIGIPLGWFAFFLLLMGEQVMSEVQLAKPTKKQDLFSLVEGHCGTYAGLGLRHWYALQWKGALRDRVETYIARNECRMEHFARMRKAKALPCGADETQAQCLSFWMQTFAKRGQWISANRRYFFSEFKSTGIAVNEAEFEKKWISYALLDHDLEMGRPNLIQQASGLEEFSDTYQYYKSADELDHLLIGRQIFEHVVGMIKPEDKSPESIRFRDVYREVQLKFEKIPELEQQVKILKARLSYNPSL